MDIEEAVANSSLENSEGIVTETLIKDIEELSSQQRLIPLKGQKTVAYITFPTIVSNRVMQIFQKTFLRFSCVWRY